MYPFFASTCSVFLKKLYDSPPGVRLRRRRVITVRRIYRQSVFHLSEGIGKPRQMKRDVLTPSYTTDWSQLPKVK